MISLDAFSSDQDYRPSCILHAHSQVLYYNCVNPSKLRLRETFKDLWMTILQPLVNLRFNNCFLHSNKK